MKFRIALLLLAAGCSTSLSAGEPAIVASGKTAKDVVMTQEEKEESLCDQIFGMATIYKDKENPVIQQFALQGRIQVQYAAGDSDQGSYGTEDRPDEVLWGDLEVRRWRLGFKSKWFHQFKLDGQIDISPNWDPEFYGKLYDLHLTWAPNDKFNIGVGKFKANFFTVEHATSSTQIITMERSLLSNTLFVGEITGVRINGKIDNWIYTTGVYAGDDQREFTEFDAGVVYQAGIGYDLKKMTGWDKSIVKLDYQYSDDEDNAGGGGAFEHSMSLNSTWEKGRFLMYTDILGGTGRGNQGDVIGFHVIPAYYLTEDLQVVFRYQYAHGDNDGIRLQSRYERLASDLTDGGRGEDYHAAYLGLNYYICSHNLKLMAGVEYHNMDGGGDGGDFDGWTGLVGVRMYF